MILIICAHPAAGPKGPLQSPFTEVAVCVHDIVLTSFLRHDAHHSTVGEAFSVVLCPTSCLSICI